MLLRADPTTRSSPNWSQTRSSPCRHRNATWLAQRAWWPDARLTRLARRQLRQQSSGDSRRPVGRTTDGSSSPPPGDPWYAPASRRHAGRGRRRRRPGLRRPHHAPLVSITNNRFWYRNDLAGGTREFILVDASTERGSRRSTTRSWRLALTKAAAAKSYTADQAPFRLRSSSHDGLSRSVSTSARRPGRATWTRTTAHGQD